MPIEGLLAKVGGAWAEVGVGLRGREVEQFVTVSGDVAGHLCQVLADVVHGADRSGVLGLPRRTPRLTKRPTATLACCSGDRDLRNLGMGRSAAAAAAQPAADGGLVSAHAVRFEPALQFGGGIKGRPVVWAGQKGGQPLRCGSGSMAVAGVDNGRMGAMMVQAADGRNYSFLSNA